jgi:hypothetical protein
MGPWSHGDWARNGAKAIGNINFGDSISGFFQRILKPPFSVVFKRQWKSQNKLPEAYVFDTDRKLGKPITFGLLKMLRRKALFSTR